jgi:predicted nucleic-acid-binding protein
VPRRKKDKKRPAVPVHLLDTNVILRYLVGDDSAKAARATALLERVDRGEEMVEIPEGVLTEAVWTLESHYQVPRSETARNLAAILSFAGVRVTAPEVCWEALQIYARSNADFVDCLLAARSKQQDIPVYTFDETDFKKLGTKWEKPMIEGPR